MSGALVVLQVKEEDVLKFLAAGTHLGGTNFDFQMEQYIYNRKSDGIYIINPKRTWDKLLLAARAIVAIEFPADQFPAEDWSAAPTAQATEWVGTTPESS
ncbi:hypothetical protein J1605_011196 [Eschrichtius robustus]|uniref:40S ribosomal protein SA n=1 Tax=Eschrichtius robustus TaxID=9764 RepID=A0AB34GPW3_ESCRO|nr:hypothetical protein J1605_011196 [Eschrichtius robustus]